MAVASACLILLISNCINKILSNKLSLDSYSRLEDFETQGRWRVRDSYVLCQKIKVMLILRLLKVNIR